MKRFQLTDTFPLDIFVDGMECSRASRRLTFYLPLEFSQEVWLRSTRSSE